MRAKPVDPENLTAEERSIWERINLTRGGVWGPYATLMQVPELAARVAAIGEFIRFHGCLPGALREFAILATAAKNRCRFEWVIHEPIARREGVSDQALAVLSGKAPEDSLDPAERLVLELVEGVISEKRVSDDLFARANETLGEKGCMELVVLVGFYTLLAGVLNVYEITELPSSG